MRLYKNMLWAGVSLVAVVLALDVASDESAAQRPSRVNRVPLTAIDWPNLTSDVVALPPERWYARDVTPAVRIREAFAQFMPGEGKRHYARVEYALQ
jgi:hypothetical protein